MESKINYLLEEVKKANEFNLDSIIKEEIQEFREAISAYEDYQDLSEKGYFDNKKKMRKKYEEVIYEACDVFVVLSQLEIPLDEALDFHLNEEAIDIFNEVIEEENELFWSVVHFKLVRTIARGKSCRYYE